MRVLIYATARVGHLHFSEEFDCTFPRLRFVHVGVEQQRFHQLSTHLERWVQDGDRLLEDEADVLATDLLPLALGDRSDITPVELHGPAREAPGCGGQTQRRQHRHALAGSGFADDAERLARHHGERNAVQDLHWITLRCRKFDVDRTNRQQRAVSMGSIGRLDIDPLADREGVAGGVATNRVSDRVTEQVERKDREHQCAARGHDLPNPLASKVRPGPVEHDAPVGIVEAGTNAKEAERCANQDDRTRNDCGLDDERGQQVRCDVARQSPRNRDAGYASSVDVQLLLLGQCDASGEPNESSGHCDTDADHGVRQRRSEDDDHRHRQQDDRQ